MSLEKRWYKQINTKNENYIRDLLPAQRIFRLLGVAKIASAAHPMKILVADPSKLPLSFPDLYDRNFAKNPQEYFSLVYFQSNKTSKIYTCNIKLHDIMNIWYALNSG